MQSQSSTPANTPRKGLRLRQITGRLKEILLDATNKPFWLQANLLVKSGGLRSGIFYCDLVDTDESGKHVAKMGAMIWTTDYQAICRKLQEAGQPNALANNAEVCVSCSIRYTDLWGLQLQIWDIDPYFREGHIDKKRRMILERLRNEGILEKNKATKLPIPALRVGLITGRNTAAYNDFVHTLHSSGFAFRTLFAPASMQGTYTESEVLASIRNLLALRVDVVCIVRGGGSQMDLSWFDNEKLARAIIVSPVPIWVGIGHEIDQCVLDFVAHTKFKTPTAVAAALVSKNQELYDRLPLAENRLAEVIERRLALANREIERNKEGLIQGMRKHVELYGSKIQQVYYRVKAGFESKFGVEENRLNEQTVGLQVKSSALITESFLKLKHSEENLLGFVPRRLVQAQNHLDVNREGLLQGARKHLTSFATRLELFARRLAGGVQTATEKKSGKLQEQEALLRSLTIHRLKHFFEALDQSAIKMSGSMNQFLVGHEKDLEKKTVRLSVERYLARIELAASALEEKGMRVQALSPSSVLRRGYSLTRDATGIIRSVAQVVPGTPLFTEVADGTITSVVRDKEERKDV